ncbi:MAG: DUF6340 family protein [Desulfovibrionaceae bacterium]
MKRLFLFFMLLPCLVWMLPGCSPVVRVAAQKPAEVALPGIHSLSVGDFQGRMGMETRRCFVDTLRASERFRIEISASAAVRVDISESLQDRRGADKRTYTSMRTRTVTVRDAGGNVLRSYTEEIPEERVESIPYVRRQARVDVRMLVESGGRVLALEETSQRLERRYGGVDCAHSGADCPEGAAPLSDMPSARSSLEILACQAGRELAEKLLPQAYEVRIPLDESGGDLVEQGVGMASDGAWAEALRLWQRALAENPNNASALYNLGVLYERSGSLDELHQAQNFYAQAASLEPKELFFQAGQRIVRRIQDVKELQRRQLDYEQ